MASFKALIPPYSCGYPGLSIYLMLFLCFWNSVPSKLSYSPDVLRLVTCKYSYHDK